MSAVMIAGASNVRTRNVRVRTRSRYSRFRITQILRIRLSHHIDEDLFERRLHHFELVEPRFGGSEPQQVLRVGIRSQAYLYVVPVIVIGLNKPFLFEKTRIPVV